MSSAAKWLYVYTLQFKGVPFYVGLTIYPELRADQHCKAGTYVTDYIRSLDCGEGELTLVVDSRFADYPPASNRERFLINSLPGLINKQRQRKKMIRVINNFDS